MPEIKAQITTGNLLQIATVVVAMAIGWGAMTARSSYADQRIGDHESRIRALETQVLRTLTSMDTRLSAIEGAVTN